MQSKDRSILHDRQFWKILAEISEI